MARRTARSPPPVSTVTVAPSTASLQVGGTQQFTATLKDANGNILTGRTITWASDNTAAATVNGTGLATAVAVGTPTITATSEAKSGSATLTVTAATVSASLSTVTASPGSIAANGEVSTITVTAKNASGNPVSGVAVQLFATGSGNTLTQPAGVTNASGVATGTLSSTVAETKTVSATIAGTAITQTAPVIVTPSTGGGGAISQALLTSGNNASNLKVYTTAAIAPAPNALVMVAVLDQTSSTAPPAPTLSGGGMSAWSQVTTLTLDTQGAPRKRLTIFRALSATPGSGPLTITSSTAVSNCQWTVSQFTGVDQSGTNGASAIGQVGSTGGDGVSGLTVALLPFTSPDNVAYGVFATASLLTITPGAGFTGIGQQSSGESPQGSLFAEWKANSSAIGASWASSNAGAVGVEIKAAGGGAPTVSPSFSTVVAGPTSFAAGGSSTITVTVKDGSGTAMSGVTVTLSAPGMTVTQPTSTTDGSGVTTGSVSSTVAGQKTVTASAGGVSLNQQPVVTVTAGAADASQSTVSANPTSITTGTGSSTITVTVKDAFGNPVSDSTVTLAATGTGNTLTQPSTTGANGVATGSLSSTDAEQKTVTAKAGSLDITQSALVTVTPPAPTVSPSFSTVVAGPTSFAAGGSSTITVTVKDGSGTAMSGVTVTLSAPGMTVTQPTSTTDGSGVTTGSVSSTVAGQKTVTASAGGVSLNQQPVVTVTAGAADASQSTVSANPTSITTGTGSSTITVTVKDAFGNPVSDSTVTLAATGTGNTLTQPSTTGANGVATGSLSSTDAEQKTVTAKAGSLDITQSALVTVNPPGSAATIAQTVLTSGTNATNQKVYTTASIAPAPNTLVLVAVLDHQSAAAAPPPTLSGGGMSTWTQVATLTFDTQGTPLKRMTIFRAMSASPGSGAITITSSVTVSNCQWIVSQFDGVDQSGANGAGAIVQTGSASGDLVSGLSVPLAAFGNVNNVAVGVFGVASKVPVVTPGAGFTEIAEQASNESPLADLVAEWAANLNSVAATWTSLNGGGLAVELKAKVGP